MQLSWLNFLLLGVERMKKKNWIVLILLLAIVCVIVIGGVSNRDTVRMQICDECEGAGTVTVADYSKGE